MWQRYIGNGMTRRRSDGRLGGVRRVPERSDNRVSTLLLKDEVASARRFRLSRKSLNRTLLLSFLFLLGAVLNGCSAPKRAVVVSLEQPSSKRIVNRSRYLYHRVRRGDTLYTIAWRYGLDYPDLARWNGIRYPYTIYPGQRLRLRGSASAAPAEQAVVRKQEVVKKSPPSGVASAGSAQPGKRSDAKQSTIAKTFAADRKLTWHWPAKGKVLQRYAKGDPARKGIKISGRLGQPVVAAESGKVVYAGSGLIGYGRLIIIKHNKNYLSAYGYNRKLLVKEGEVVKRGQRVAEMGEQGGDRPKLHFEIRRNGTPVDPMRLLPRQR
jgi:lipoprotein NlpD